MPGVSLAPRVRSALVDIQTRNKRPDSEVQDHASLPFSSTLRPMTICFQSGGKGRRSQEDMVCPVLNGQFPPDTLFAPFSPETQESMEIQQLRAWVLSILSLNPWIPWGLIFCLHFCPSVSLSYHWSSKSWCLSLLLTFWYHAFLK